MIDSVLLQLGILLLVFVFGAGLGPHATQPQPEALGASRFGFAAPLLALAARETPHSRPLGDHLGLRNIQITQVLLGERLALSAAVQLERP